MSYSYHMPVREMLSEKLAITALLTVFSFVLTVALSIPLGILAGSVRKEPLDRAVTALDQVVMSVPAFFIGILVCFCFGNLFQFFVPGDFVSYKQDWGACLAYLFFPALSIAIPRIAMTVKMLRGSILKELGQDYVRTAQSRGASRAVILRRHVLRNALLPVITFLAVSAAEIMTGSIIIEQVFTIPGVGRLLLTSISNRDFPVVQASVLVIATSFVVANVLTDLVLAYADPISNRDFPVVQAIVVILAAWIVVVNFVADLLYQLVDPRIRLR